MSDYAPTYLLYNSSDTAVIYTFTNVFGDSSIGKNPKRYSEHDGFRGYGSIIVPGSQKAPFNIELKFRLQASNYEALIAKIDALDTTIVYNTPYILKIGRTPSTSKSWNVKRLEDSSWNENGNLVRFADMTVILRANSWS